MIDINRLNVLCLSLVPLTRPGKALSACIFGLMFFWKRSGEQFLVTANTAC